MFSFTIICLIIYSGRERDGQFRIRTCMRRILVCWTIMSKILIIIIMMMTMNKMIIGINQMSIDDAHDIEILISFI